MHTHDFSTSLTSAPEQHALSRPGLTFRGSGPGACLARMRAVIAEITAETKAAVMQIVEQTKRRSGWRVYRTLAVQGVPRSVYYAWKKGFVGRTGFIS